MSKISCSHVLKDFCEMKPFRLSRILLGRISKRKAFIYNGSFVRILFSYRRCYLS